MMNGPGGQPIYILKEGANQTGSRSAQANNIMAAKAVAESVRSTLGPLGFDKMLVDGGGRTVITNDGATILREIDADHPAAKLVIEISQTQEAQCHDGTTSAAVLAGALLGMAEELIDQKIHPGIICKGYHAAGAIIDEELDKMGWPCRPDELRAAARTSITGKSAESATDVLADISVTALTAVRDETGVDLDNIKVSSFEGGTYDQSELLPGLVVEKERIHREMPTALTSAKVLLLTTPLEPKETKIESRLNISDPGTLEAFLAREEEAIQEVCHAIAENGTNAVFCGKNVDDLSAHYLAQANILTVKRVKSSDMEALRRITGAKLINNPKDLRSTDLGEATSITEERFGEHRCVCVRAEGAKSVTAILRGATGFSVEELERIFDDVMGVVVLSDGKTLVAGGGSAYAHLARALRKRQNEAPGRQAMAVEAFSRALEAIPRTLAENAGVDPVDTILELRNAKVNDGITIDGEIKDMAKLGVVEPRTIIQTAISSAIEVSTHILRIDDVISLRQTADDLPPGMMGMG